MMLLREWRQAFERYWDGRRERIRMAIIGQALVGALIFGGFAIVHYDRVFDGDGTMDGDEFISNVRCEPVAFVTQLGGAFGHLGHVEGNVIRYKLVARRVPPHRHVPQAGRAVKEPGQSPVSARPAPVPPRAPAADTYTDCTLP